MGYINKIKVGRGNINQFRQDYESINNEPLHKCNASQLFVVNGHQGEENLYEYIIYYSVLEVTQ